MGKKIRKKSLVVLGCLGFFYTGCMPLPVDEKVPEHTFSDQWKDPSVQTTVTDEQCLNKDAWWEVYEDQKLNDFIAHGMEQSPSIKQALARLDQALCYTTIVGADRIPQVGINGYADRRRIPSDLQGSGSVLTGNFITPTTTAPLPVPPEGISPIVVPAIPEMKKVKSPAIVNNLIADVLISYEFDFWGKYYLEEKASVLRAEAAQSDLGTARLILANQIASTYFSIQAYQYLLRLTQEEIEAQKQLIDLLQKQLETGLTNTFTLLQEQTFLATKQVEEQNFLQNIEVNKTLLAVLIGEDPNSYAVDVPDAKWNFPIVPPTVPASLLFRRPDLMAYTKQVEAQIARIGARKADLLPSFSMSLALGYQASLAHEWFKWKNRIWDLAGSLYQPLFDAGKRFAEVDLAKAEYREAASSLTQAVLSSVKEVQDAMTAIRSQQERRKAALLRKQEQFSAFSLRNGLCDTGVDAYIVVLQDKIQLLEAERSLVQEEYNLQLGTLMLIKSLGGGFAPAQLV